MSRPQSPESIDASAYLARLFSLTHKTFIITGASRGLGLSLAETLLDAGASVILIIRDPASLPPILSKWTTSTPRRVDVYTADLSLPEQVKGLIDRILADGHHVDGLVNCAGTTHRAPAEDFPDEEWDRILQVNLKASFVLSRDLAKHWLSFPYSPSHKKKIVNISSVLTFFGSLNVPAYTSSKGGLGQLTKALSNEWAGKGICVNAIAPGYFKTDLTDAIRADEEYAESVLKRVPMGRWGEGRDLSWALVYLCSAASDFVSGTTLTVDGGFCGR